MDVFSEEGFSVIAQARKVLDLELVHFCSASILDMDSWGKLSEALAKFGGQTVFRLNRWDDVSKIQQVVKEDGKVKARVFVDEEPSVIKSSFEGKSPESIYELEQIRVSNVMARARCIFGRTFTVRGGERVPYCPLCEERAGVLGHSTSDESKKAVLKDLRAILEAPSVFNGESLGEPRFLYRQRSCL